MILSVGLAQGDVVDRARVLERCAPRDEAAMRSETTCMSSSEYAVARSSYKVEPY